MNERIKQLADRAGEYADFESGLCTDEFLKKFAELIIRDCVVQCQIIADQCQFVVTGEMARKTKATAESCAYMIKLRFGVEE